MIKYLYLLALSLSANATPTPRAMICNADDLLVKLVEQQKSADLSGEAWLGTGGDRLLRVLVQDLVVNPHTGTMYGPRMRVVSVREILTDLDSEKEIAVRPGAEHCVELFVGADARALSNETKP